MNLSLYEISFCSIKGDASAVAIKLAPCTACTQNNGAYSYSWGDEVAAPDTVSFTLNRNASGESYVDITGFDYSANWCGLSTSSSGSTPHGFKLVVYVDFILNVTPELQNVDPIYCNTSASGLYDKDGVPVSGGSFDNPVIPFGRIIVKTSGLKNGHSAIFRIDKGTTQIYDIVVTGKSDGSTISTIIPLLMPNETYTVTENTGWSWNYTTDDASRSQSKTFDENGGTVTFTFENTFNGYPMNSEKAVRNSLQQVE